MHRSFPRKLESSDNVKVQANTSWVPAFREMSSIIQMQS
jgi:hypothetical protein